MVGDRPGSSSLLHANVKSLPAPRRRLEPITRSTTSSPPLPLPSPTLNTTYDDASSDNATLRFVRRILCAHHIHIATIETSQDDLSTLDALLPPLTSSNDVDLQLYAFIAIIIQDCVNPWYSKITSDHVFIDEVVHIIAHCTRALEERLRKLDLEALFLDDIPALLDAHIDGMLG